MKNIIHFVPGSVILGIVLILLAFASINCVETPLTPVAPTSEIKLEGISIIDLTRTFADFLVKDTTLSRNPDGTSFYKKSESMAPQGIPAIILQTQPSSQQVGVGLFEASGLAPVTSTTTIAQMNLQPLDYPGALPPFVPPFPAQYVSRPGDTINSSSQFDYVAVNSGSLTLKFTNNLPLQLVFNRPIILRNNQLKPFVDTSVVAVFNVGTVDSGGTPNGIINRTSDLAGKILRGSMKFDSISFTTQPRSTPFSLKSTSGISVLFSSSKVIADSASAVIPTQTVASIKDSVLKVDSLTVIKSAVFSKGKIILRLANNLGIDVTAKLTVNEMKQNGASYVLNQTLTAKQTQDILLDFSTISILADLPLRQYGTTVKFSVGITTIDSKGAKKTVTKNDYVKASFIPQDPLVVKSVDGKIAPTLVQINEGIKSGINAADLGDLSAQVALKGMQLTIKLPITGGFPTDYNLSFIAKNSKKNFTNSVQLISAPNSTTFPRINPPATAVIQLSSIPGFDLDGFISGFFPDVPDSFFVRGTFTLDPQDIFAQTNTYQIADTTKVYPSFDLNLPVAVGIKNGVIKEVLPFSKDQVPKDFTKNVGQGTLTFYFYNMLPFKMFFSAKFLGNYNPQTHKADTLLSIAPSDTIQPAAVDKNSGLTTFSTFSKVSVSLNSSQMVQFNNADSLFVRIDMSTSNNGQVVKVRDTDYIRVYAKGDITYTIGKQ
jgi:hypothetical protein